MNAETVGVQACRTEDRAMLATPAGAELVAKAAAALGAYRCIAPLCAPLGCSACNCAVPADVYAVLMRAERADLGEAAARDQMQRANLAALAGENDKLRAALTELLACHTEVAGWAASMMADRAAFDEMLTRSQARLGKAVLAARLALGA
jgi:hypothetical protein